VTTTASAILAVERAHRRGDRFTATPPDAELDHVA
jgi:hypothetical protein